MRIEKKTKYSLGFVHGVCPGLLDGRFIRAVVMVVKRMIFQ